MIYTEMRRTKWLSRPLRTGMVGVVESDG